MERRDARAAAPDRPRGWPGPVGEPGRDGPRQEYLDAFDRAEPLAAPPTTGPRLPEQRGPADRGRSGPGTRAARRRAGAVSGPEPGEGGGGRAARRERQRREGRESWGRSLVGVTALALVTVLVVLVAGQLARPDRDAEPPGLADEGERFALDPDQGTDARPAPPGEDEPEAEPDYDALLTTTFPLDPDLTGSGELVPVPGTEAAADPEATTVLRYRVDVEEGLGIDPGFFAEVVHRTLSDGRSWGNAGERGFARVSDGDYDFVVTLASPGTTADWCARSGLDTTEDNVSCNSSSTERVMINAWRFAQGSETYGDDIANYRRMLVNHEVGHRLGYGHAVCPAEGAVAPVMMQQTKFLTIDGVTCEANPWPHPGN